MIRPSFDIKICLSCIFSVVSCIRISFISLICFIILICFVCFVLICYCIIWCWIGLISIWVRILAILCLWVFILIWATILFRNKSLVISLRWLLFLESSLIYFLKNLGILIWTALIWGKIVSRLLEISRLLILDLKWDCWR